MTVPVDSDLTDFFKLIFGDDSDDGSASDDEPEPPAEGHPSDIPDPLYSARITRKRLMSTLDSLFSSGPVIKKQRIYNPPSPSILSLIPSTQAIPDLPPSSTYAPFSPLALLSRLRTFQPFSYSPAHPAELSPVKAALNGWINEGREGLRCEQCNAKWGLGGLENIKEESIRGEMVSRVAKGLEGRHTINCPWRINRSPGEDDLYDKLRHLTHPPITSSLSPLAFRLSSECPPLPTIKTSSPISDAQTTHLISLLSAHSEQEHGVGETSAVMALFGWYPYHPNESSIRVVPEKEAVETDLVACRICHRHIGLWHFKPYPSSSDPASSSSSSPSPPRYLDVLDEHLTWCPIRHQPWEHHPWWEKTALLGGGDGAKGRMSEGDVKGLVRVSEKLEKKKWRRV
ncbi:hypothetical protein IAR50_007586 [Cryptococcus sp. DSM 104548]